MSITVQYPRQTIQQGMSFFLPFSLVADVELTKELTAAMVTATRRR